jgi:TetR/AcrR family transcriptional repressor of nem operon
MARPREFDETTVLEAAMNCFWAQGFEQTSVRDLAERMGITGASLYNAFGDKRSLYRRPSSIISRRRCGTALRG